MQSVDPDGALQMYMKSGEWDKCIELAKQQVMFLFARLFIFSLSLCLFSLPLSYRVKVY